MYTYKSEPANTTVTHISLNARYKIQFEQAATKGILGFKVEANGDDLEAVKVEVQNLLTAAIEKARIYQNNLIEVKP